MQTPSKTMILEHLDEDLYQQLDPLARSKVKYTGVLKGVDGSTKFECSSREPFGSGYLLNDVILEFVTYKLEDDGIWRKTVQYTARKSYAISSNIAMTCAEIPQRVLREDRENREERVAEAEELRLPTEESKRN